jgi:hypothetical protein
MVSFANDIRPLFRPIDVQHMQDVDPDYDLSDYDSVKDHADVIYERLADGSMPPGHPWPAANVARFKQWIDENYPA